MVAGNHLVERGDTLPETTARPAAIIFGNQRLRAAKAFHAGTHRGRDPRATYDLLKPFLATAGVTRVADVTGLDRVGVPTTLVIRPNSQTIACSSGKGITIEQAMTSGAMEALELHAAETVELPMMQASYAELSHRYPMPRPDLWPMRRRNVFSTQWPIPWTMGWDLLGQRAVPVPTTLVGMSRRHAFITNVGAFHVTSNGLGAGNSVLEAISAALYEVIERDAVACTYAAAESGHREAPILARDDLDTYPLVRDVLAKCDRADVVITVHDCTVDTGVPTYNALAHDAFDSGVGVIKGSGTHLEPEIAILRAVTEALQARLNFIAGSRDDIFRSAFVRSQADYESAAAAIRRGREEGPWSTPIPSHAMDTFEEDVSVLLDRIASIGLEHVMVFDITPEGFPVNIVRVIVPGLEGYQNHGFQLGPRGLAAAAGNGTFSYENTSAIS